MLGNLNVEFESLKTENMELKSQVSLTYSFAYAINTHSALVATNFACALPKSGRKQLIDTIPCPNGKRIQKKYFLWKSKLGSNSKWMLAE